MGNILQKINKRKLAAVLVLLVVLALSMTVVQKAASDPENHTATIEALDEKKADVLKLTASSAAAATALAAVPGDATTPVANKLADLTSYFLIVLMVVFLEKYLVTLTGYATFFILIPLACVLLGIGICAERPFLKVLARKVAAFGLVLFLRDTPTSVGLPELEGTEVDNGSAQGTADRKGVEYKAFLMKHVFRNPLIWILGAANFFVYVVRFSVLDWGPSLLSQSKGVSMAHAGWLVAMFEIAGILGMLFAGWATDRWLKGRAHRTCVFCMAGAALFVFLFWRLPSDAPIWLLFATLCAAGFCIYGPQALIGIAAANQATKKAAATANGLTGLFGYASTLVSGVGLGFVAQHYGWNWAYAGILAMSLIGMGVFLLMWGARADGYAPEPERK